MNIGIFTDTYSPQINGVVTSITLLKKELIRKGHQVYIFTSTDPNADKSVEQRKIFRFPSVPFYFFPERRLAIAGYFKISKLVKDLEIDVVHTHTEFSLGMIGKMVAKKHNIPIVHTYHTIYENYLHYIGNGKVITPPMVRKVSKLYFKNIDTAIVPSQKTKSLLENYGIETECKVVPTGIDFEQFKIETSYLTKKCERLKNRLGINKGQVLLSLGRLSKEKNIETILRAMPDILKVYPDTTLLIVGDGPEKERLITLTINLTIQESVHFIGEVRLQEVSNYYYLSDLLLSASTTETQGLTLFEAIASKTPVVTKADQATDNIFINGKTGFIYQNDHELAETVIHALSPEVNLEGISKRAFIKIQELSLSNFSSDILDVYKKGILNNNLDMQYKKPKVHKQLRYWLRTLL